MLSSHPPSQEDRKSVRITRSLAAMYSSNCPPIAARVEDVSETGMYLDTHHPLSLGQLIRFRIELPDDQPDKPIEGVGRVVWTEQMLGAGIEFVQIDPADKTRIRFYVAEQLFSPPI